MLRIEIDSSKSLFVSGEAIVSILKGKVEVFGAVFEKDEVVRVEENKSAPFKPLDEKLAVEVKLSNSGYVSYIEGDLIPEDWKKIAGEIAEVNEKISVMIVGGVDVGKTGFVTFLANKLHLSGKKVAIVDADTGQSSIGPPTTIGLGFLNKKIVHLTEVPLFDAIFVGCTTPAGVLDRSIIGTHILVKKAFKNNADVVLIDTTGWVSDKGGRELKTSKIYLVNPNYLILIEKEFGELFHIAKPFLFSSIKIRNLSPPPMLRARSREVRRIIRYSIFSKYFKDAEEIEVKLASVNIRYARLGTGRVIKDEDLGNIIQILGYQPDYVEVTNDSVIIYSKESLPESQLDEIGKIFDKKEVINITPTKIENVLLSLRDKNDKFLGLGILKKFNPVEKSLTIYTNVNEEKIKTIEVGHIKVSETGGELEYFAPWTF